MPQRTLYTTDFDRPDFIVRARTQTLEMPLRRNGAQVAPTSGEVTIKDGSGADIVSAAGVTVTDGVATYQLLSATIPATLAFSDFWREVWTLIVAGDTIVIERPAALVREDIYPTVSADYIRGLHTDLARAYTPAETQGFGDKAWGKVNRHLLKDARKPYRILDASDLFEVHECTWLELMFRDMWSSSAGGKFRSNWEAYKAECAKAWDELRIDYDVDDDGNTDPDETGQSGQPLLYTTKIPAWRRGPYGGGIC